MSGCFAGVWTYTPAQIMASHSQCPIPGQGDGYNRHLSDRVIDGILERDGCIGVVPYNAVS